MTDLELVQNSLDRTNEKLEEIMGRVGKYHPSLTEDPELKNLYKYRNFLDIVEYFMYKRLQSALTKDLALINAVASSSKLGNNNGSTL